MELTIAKRYSYCNSNLRIPVDSWLLFNEAMENKEIRRLNLIRLVNEYGSQANLGVLTDTPPTMFSAIINKAPGRNLGDRLARRIEDRLKLGTGWMDAIHPDDDPSAGALANPEITMPLMEEWREIRKAVEEAHDLRREKEALEAENKRLKSALKAAEGGRAYFGNATKRKNKNA